MKQAVILAAGRGSRMLEQTVDKPKCLVELGGRTLLDWQLISLKKAGVEEISIVAGYLSNIIVKQGYPCIHNPHWDKSNMVESLFCAHHVLCRQTTIISYSDIAYHSQIIAKLLQTQGDIVIPYDILWKDLWQDRFADPLVDAETFRISQGKVIEIGRKPIDLAEVQGQYLGLMKLTPAGWASIQQLLAAEPHARQKIDMTTLLQKLIDSHIPVYGTPVAGKWCEVDSPGDLLCYTHKLSEGKPWTHDFRDE